MTKGFQIEVSPYRSAMLIFQRLTTCRCLYGNEPGMTHAGEVNKNGRKKEEQPLFDVCVCVCVCTGGSMYGRHVQAPRMAKKIGARTKRFEMVTIATSMMSPC